MDLKPLLPVCTEKVPIGIGLLGFPPQIRQKLVACLSYITQATGVQATLRGRMSGFPEPGLALLESPEPLHIRLEYPITGNQIANLQVQQTVRQMVQNAMLMLGHELIAMMTHTSRQGNKMEAGQLSLPGSLVDDEMQQSFNNGNFQPHSSSVNINITSTVVKYADTESNVEETEISQQQIEDNISRATGDGEKGQMQSLLDGIIGQLQQFIKNSSTESTTPSDLKDRQNKSNNLPNLKRLTDSLVDSKKRMKQASGSHDQGRTQSISNNKTVKIGSSEKIIVKDEHQINEKRIYPKIAMKLSGNKKKKLKKLMTQENYSREDALRLVLQESNSSSKFINNDSKNVTSLEKYREERKHKIDSAIAVRKRFMSLSRPRKKKITELMQQGYNYDDALRIVTQHSNSPSQVPAPVKAQPSEVTNLKVTFPASKPHRSSTTTSNNRILGGLPTKSSAVQFRKVERLDSNKTSDNRILGALPTKSSEGQYRKVERLDSSKTSNNRILGGLPTKSSEVQFRKVERLDSSKASDNRILGALPTKSSEGQYKKVERLDSSKTSNNRILGGLPTKSSEVQFRKIEKLDSSKTSGKLTVAIFPDKYPELQISEKVKMKKLEEAVGDVIKFRSENTKLPEIGNCFLENGRVIMVCNNEYTRDWLKKIVPILNMWYDENGEFIRLRAVNWFNTTGFKKFYAEVSGPPVSNEKILSRLAKQNFGLNTKMWEICEREEDKFKCTKLSIIVDPQSIETIKKYNMKPVCGTARLCFSSESVDVLEQQNDINVAAARKDKETEQFRKHTLDDFKGRKNDGWHGTANANLNVADRTSNNWKYGYESKKITDLGADSGKRREDWRDSRSHDLTINNERNKSSDNRRDKENETWRNRGGESWKDRGGESWKDIGGESWKDRVNDSSWRDRGGDRGRDTEIDSWKDRTGDSWTDKGGDRGRDRESDSWKDKGGDSWKDKGGDSWKDRVDDSSWRDRESDNWRDIGGESWNDRGSDSWKDIGGDSWKDRAGDSWKDIGSDKWKGKGGDSWKDKGGDSWKDKGGDSWKDRDVDSWKDRVDDSSRRDRESDTWRDRGDDNWKDRGVDSWKDRVDESSWRDRGGDSWNDKVSGSWKDKGGDRGRDRESDSWKDRGSDNWKGRESDSWKDRDGDSWNYRVSNSWQDIGGDSWKDRAGDSWKDIGSDKWKDKAGDSWKDKGGDSWKDRDVDSWKDRVDDSSRRDRESDTWRDRGDDNWKDRGVDSWKDRVDESSWRDRGGDSWNDKVSGSWKDKGGDRGRDRESDSWKDRGSDSWRGRESSSRQGRI